MGRKLRETLWIVCAAAIASAAPAVAGTGDRLSNEYVAIRTLDLSPALRLEVSGLQYLLTADELADLLARPENGRCRRWIDRWWERLDPVYTTRENEVRRQHEMRVRQARALYPVPRWPGWDQRGEIHIRYGAPAWRNTTIPFFFEVYNLSPGRAGECEYTVSYRLVPEAPRPMGFFEFTPDDTPLDVSSRFTSRCPGPDDVVHIAIGTENLWPGRYRLEVEITDETTNAQVTGERTFHVADDVAKR